MKHFIPNITLFSPVVVLIFLVFSALPGWSSAIETNQESSTFHQSLASKVVKIKDARIKIELNDTDGDAGIQVFLDADSWEWIEIYDPKGKKVFRSMTEGRMAKQGGTELFLESAEPNFSALPLDKFLDRFPEGKYRIRGKGLNGEKLVGAATLTHKLPEGPQLVSPLAAQGAVAINSAAVSWKPVPNPVGSKIIGYQVLVVLPKSNFQAIPKIILDVMMPASATSMEIPPGFLSPNTEYEWEVLAIEEGGNQTLSTAFFKTAP